MVYLPDKFVAGVVDSAETAYRRWVTPVIDIHSRISPRIFEKIQNNAKGILEGPGYTDS
jgi:hypothetical protein